MDNLRRPGGKAGRRPLRSRDRQGEHAVRIAARWGHSQDSQAGRAKGECRRDDSSHGQGRRGLAIRSSWHRAAESARTGSKGFRRGRSRGSCRRSRSGSRYSCSDSDRGSNAGHGSCLSRPRSGNGSDDPTSCTRIDTTLLTAGAQDGPRPGHRPPFVEWYRAARARGRQGHNRELPETGRWQSSIRSRSSGPGPAYRGRRTWFRLESR